MAEKIDMALDDIIKLEGIGKKKGRRGGGVAGNSKAGRSRIVKSKLRSPRTAPFKRANPDRQWKHDMFEGPRGGATGPTRLLVANLDYERVTDKDIKELFMPFGNMAKAALHYDRSGRSLGTADVIFLNRNSALAAIKKYDGILLDGRPLKITLVPDGPSPSSKRGFQSRGVTKFSRGGSVRNRVGGNRASVGGGRGGFAGGRNRRQPRKQLTAEELDADLDAHVRHVGHF